MDVAPFVFQRQPLGDAEAVLFVHDYQAEIGKLHVVLKQGVGADGQMRAAVGNRGFGGVFLFLFQAA